MISFEAQGGLEPRHSIGGHHEQTSSCWYSRFGHRVFDADFGGPYRTRSCPAVSRHARCVKEYGPRATSVYRRARPELGALALFAAVGLAGGKGIIARRPVGV